VLRVLPELIDRRFRLEREVGSGGMGRIWRAHDAETGRVVAIKVIATDAPTAVERFAREAVILAEIRHPGICARLAILEHYRAQSADLDAQHHGYTPLMGAAQGGHLEVVKWLAAHGAHPRGALEQARRFGHEDVVKYLQTRVPTSGE
jgi:serine/threonine protein kinase